MDRAGDPDLIRSVITLYEGLEEPRTTAGKCVRRPAQCADLPCSVSLIHDDAAPVTDSISRAAAAATTDDAAAPATDATGAINRRLVGERGHVRGHMQTAARCTIDERGTPMARWILAALTVDLALLWERLEQVPADIRAVLLPDLVEDFTAQALGATEALPFWRGCFGALDNQLSPPFFITISGSAEHVRLWDVK
mmetsp:Transcript_20000/g.40705  ORF Transcript_20000/g.40705 Transcript_20000/m.40705 type:complete len:196 (+) Transcript_20000:1242-1829(+)